MDIPKMSIDTAQSSIMTAVNTKLLSMSLDTLKQNGEQMTEMLEESGAQVMNAGHIDLLT
ncbi:MAG: putative motility protein [Lachnospiraceae bacterium]|nr:putative motility protein [Lachnospiraceae bacterium]